MYTKLLTAVFSILTGSNIAERTIHATDMFIQVLTQLLLSNARLTHSVCSIPTLHKNFHCKMFHQSADEEVLVWKAYFQSLEMWVLCSTWAFSHPREDHQLTILLRYVTWKIMSSVKSSTSSYEICIYKQIKHIWTKKTPNKWDFLKRPSCLNHEGSLEVGSTCNFWWKWGPPALDYLVIHLKNKFNRFCACWISRHVTDWFLLSQAERTSIFGLNEFPGNNKS